MQNQLPKQNKKNYSMELEKIIRHNSEAGKIPTLLLHSCCAPCSSYVLEYLSRYFRITVFYFNPNIYPEEEFLKRLAEQEKLINELPAENKIELVGSEHMSARFYEAVRGLESLGEGSERCRQCFRLRLEETAKLAAEKGFDYFTTTLTISPMKNAAVLNDVGEQAGLLYGVGFLPSDFKKKGGYQRSTQLSKEYGLYRQDYCGCVFSLKERDKRLNQQKKNGE
ncbi:MAG: epoxyqueuosine reductase QueH [Huintestinicola sp.]